MARYSAYDRFARIYNQHWGDDFTQRTVPILDKLILSRLPAGARVLDVCCGTGQLARVLTARGYRVIGLDGSEEMLRFARENAPGCEFLLGDARDFSLPPVYHGAVSTFDSLNHILSLDELTSAFRCAHAALLDGGLFVFDLNMEEGYKSRWRGSFGIVEDDHACLVRSSYRPDERIGQMDLTLFFLEDGWQRSDLTLTQRCYAEAEVRAALAAAGFDPIQAHDAQRDLELPGGIGRTFFVAHKGGA
jgi:SAM-dependent methyltransferase